MNKTDALKPPHRCRRSQSTRPCPHQETPTSALIVVAALLVGGFAAAAAAIHAAITP